MPMRRIERRAFMKGVAAAAGAALVPGHIRAQTDAGELKPITGCAVPIGRAEREARIARAQRLMRQQGLSAILIEPGASLVYFTGVRWGRSERLTGAVIPEEGPIGVFTPFFEEPSVRESLAVPADLRTWNEHEDPLALVGRWLKERKLGSGAIGVEETVRYFAVDGLQRALPGVRIVSAAPVVRALRMIKSPAEIALMQRAADVTIAAYRYTAPRIQAGMTPAEIGAIMNGATACGLPVPCG